MGLQSKRKAHQKASVNWLARVVWKADFSLEDEKYEQYKTWKEFKRAWLKDHQLSVFLSFKDSRRVKQTATTKPKDWDGWNRASRRWAWKHRKELLNGTAQRKASNG